MLPLIITYTNEVKEYCDVDFFSNLHKISVDGGASYDVAVIDNTPGTRYTKRLNGLCGAYDNFTIHHLHIPREPRKSLFQRNVAESVERARRYFLTVPDYTHMLVIESDVIPPTDIVRRFSERLIELPADWGALGALYYKNFHDYEKTGLHPTNHVLSGCTLYNRPLLKAYPFRYDPESLAQFPDFWICYDSGKEFSLWNDHDIHCAHLHTKNGSRASKPL